jgi:hypothetical protein
VSSCVEIRGRSVCKLVTTILFSHEIVSLYWFQIHVM